MTSGTKISTIVTDIEGTTSSIRFVHEVLFPYAAEHIARFVQQNQAREDVAALLADVVALAGLPDDNIDGVVAQLQQWIQDDQKITPLKTLQGLLWQEGYEQGHFKGHVYADANANLRAWAETGMALYVYSSGSVAAQKLIFGYSEFGDLTPCFKGYFDTHIGAKRDIQSYRNILSELEVAPEQVLFLSDIEAELEAASAAGMQTVWLVRDGEIPAGAQYEVARDFDEVNQWLIGTR
ncbi:MAG: acireductone synthase [Pseudomonadales bacterium]|nr:acireductone synthase [Pseudomonadales bacterium]